MTLSYSWLCNYLPEHFTADELSKILTSVGLEVENVEEKESLKGSLQGLVIGKVIACETHPNADKLKCTKVDIGSGELLPIVCGASNVAAGQKVIIATVGTKLYPTVGESFEIKKAKIRGEESAGMICAEDEIGLGTHHEGILVLPDEVAVGTLAKDYYNIPSPEIIFEIGLTPNRMDAMSHLGAVKDICAYIGNQRNSLFPSKLPSIQLPISTEEKSISIFIEDNARCVRYAGLLFDHIVVQDSPDWLQNRLRSIGLKPINNIVDITNFVLHECGQPLHAFDRSAIKGDEIHIKTLTENTKFVTLDDKERDLLASDLMICNAEEPMCIAGIYGGLHSGVQQKTTSIFLECACFDKHSIRKTSLHHGLRTDAAIRFEKGTDVSNIPYALQRAAQLICELSGATIVSKLIDVYPQPIAPTSITLYFDKVRKVSGKNYINAQIKNILTHLCFSVLEETNDFLVLQVPFAKSDVSIQEDVIEEIMRIDGLDNIPFTGKINFSLPTSSEPHSSDIKSIIAQRLVGKGMHELFTNSITNSAFYPERTDVVKMMNSLSAELDSMRPSMLETGLNVIQHNINRKNNQLHLFEFGKTYQQQNNAFIEKEQVCFYFSGNYQNDTWMEKTKPIDIYFVKGIIDSVCEAMKPVYEATANGLSILFQNQPFGYLEKVKDAMLKLFDIKQDVWFVSLDWKIIENFYRTNKMKSKPIPKFPLVERDLAMVLEKNIPYQEVQKAVKKAKSKLLQKMDVFDVFESEKLGTDKKSYAIHLSFYHEERTLTDTEIEQEMNAIIDSIETNIGGLIRKS